MIKEIEVRELNEKFNNKEDFTLLDVRNLQEVLFSKIKNSIHIPMNEIPERFDELDKNKEIIVQCKSGKRSAKVCEYLITQNFTNIKNLRGGILAWAQEIDPSIKVY
tara:strand:- start:931 stop:1251 length:321 start_codon:yes stop_codon:yes gene_type:complete